MLAKLLKLAAILAVGYQVSACATIVEGSSMAVNVATTDGTNPVPSECTFSSPGIGTLKMKAPGSITLPKSKHDATVVCTAAGYNDGNAKLVSHPAAAAAGNILWGAAGLIGFGAAAIVDASTGAAFKYDDNITVTLTKIPEPPKPPEPTKRPRAPRAAPPPS